MEKYFLKSKTIIGALIALLGGLGVTLPFTPEEVQPVLESLQVIIGFALTVYGRAKATKPLGLGL